MPCRPMAQVTGVSLVDDFCVTCSMKESLRNSARLLSATAAGTVALGAAIWVAQTALDRAGACQPSDRPSMLRALASSLLAPHRMLLPAYWVTHSLTIVAATSQIVLANFWPKLARECSAGVGAGHGGMTDGIDGDAA